jgi:tetratricopeptide (TPR) repeat protein
MQGAGTPVVVEPVGTPGMTVAPGSDLFRQMQIENASLKKRLAQLESKSNKALSEAEKKQEIEEKYQVARTTSRDRGKVIDKLVAEIQRLEKEKADAMAKAAEKGTMADSMTDELSTLRTELDRRERRLKKAEKMAAWLDDARSEVRKVSDAEKRDMHYNMASVYAKEGKFKSAEREYLRALRLDPTDAGVHYNLGILYDDSLDDKRRAALHYRKFIQLAPHDSSVDAVKGWLMKIEIDSGI